MQSNHTQLLTLTNNRLTHLFKQNGNDKRFMAEFPYKLDQVEKHWQIDEYHINPTLNSAPMILTTCQITYQNLAVADCRLYFDKNERLIDEFFTIKENEKYPPSKPYSAPLIAY
ncbi:hypothetical protein LP123_00850 [Moraxella bovis]|uniref:Uncharacterized protein n=1 Tax=Moraxella bovis TaxID=476 RepID=A0AAQ2Q359_MORBO|nr:hypothetical protein [Moraxella bovis]OOR89109.1 hypothetical protein B0182_07805 [Moraxella bovis]UYZ75617.1 hypothetical protein LP093_12955 [Moraxella bovis]UYZ78441.1 hypothetical protein LP115_00845 [Moraxella bovis]UYZ81328.1 hypothetical protein LP113_00850 [Moraxella bovis]UYZ86923.1 hypothetical protein LP094_00845 [Moraxella bovis]